MKSATKILSVKVINNLGEIIYSQQVNSESINIDLNREQNGIYFVQVNSEKNSITEKLIILK